MATQLDREQRDFLRHRVGVFGLVAACLGGAFLLVRLVIPAQLAGSPASIATHAAAVASFAAVWLSTRRRGRSTRALRVIEAGGLLVGGTFYALMGLDIPPAIRPELIIAMAMIALMMVRAVYVPTSAHRTAALTGAMGVPLLAATWLIWTGMPEDRYASYAAAAGFDIGLTGIAAARVAEVALWWLAAVAICTLASKVIYGLRREVRELGQYTLGPRIGAGGMGEVYRASHAMLRRPTAIKLLASAMEGEQIERFEREVQRTAELTHPNTITIFDFGRTPDGTFYYAMELLDGLTLDQVVEADGPLPPGRVVRILGGVLGALGEAHGVGLIHRDINPANIMLVEQGGQPEVPKVLDFGLVKEIESDADTALTDVDTVMGTPLYMPPELIRGADEVDGRADLYAVGAVAYFLLTGTHVFSGKTVLEVCSHHLQSEPEPPSSRLGAPLPADLEAVILSALAKDPGDRPASSADMAARLAACDLEPWTDADARSWWRQHRPAPVDQGAPIEHAQTVAIDLAQR